VEKNHIFCFRFQVSGLRLKILRPT
jgi:hypothetical protein